MLQKKYLVYHISTSVLKWTIFQAFKCISAHYIVGIILVNGGQEKCCAFFEIKYVMLSHSDAEISPF